MERFSSLRFSDRTDLFMHEVRGALGPLISDSGLKWSEDEYEAGRQKVLNILNRFGEFSDDGLLDGNAMRNFIHEITRDTWNSKNTGKLWTKFLKFAKTADDTLGRQ